MMNKESIIRDDFARLEDDWESASRYLSMFIDESVQTLDELTTALLALEAGGGQKDIEQLFISAHRLKGSAATIGLNRPARLAHLMEDILQALVDDGSTLDPKIADGLLACTDGLRHYVDAMKTGRPEEDHFADLAQQLADAQAICDTALGRAVTTTPLSEAMKGEAAAVTSEKAAATGDDAKAEPAANGARPGVNAELHQRVAVVVRDQERDNTLVGQVLFDPDFPLLGLKAQLVCDKLSNLGNVRFLDPPLAEVETIEEVGSLYFGVVTERNVEDIRRMLHIAGVQQITIEPLAAKPSDAVTSAPGQANLPTPGANVAASAVKTAKSGGKPAEAGAKPMETVRVDIDRLDGLMNLAGQLAIGKARVAQIGDRLKQVMSAGDAIQTLNRIGKELKRIAQTKCDAADGLAHNSDLERLYSSVRQMHVQLESVQREMESFSQAKACVNDLFETIHLLDGVSDGIRQSVMDMRMLPIGPLFGRFHRVIRDITRANGKDIHLTIGGEKTELDKRMIDELGDPMIHLVRNAADHGIESPDDRAAAGKPRQGTISLDACHRGSSIVIRVADDGKGLDAERIRAKAVEKGLVAAADADAMTRQQIFQFIWHPGLSTAEKVTDVSGRGVGMDIVRSKIRDLNGTIDVDSEPGRGATFTIKLPLTLAVLPSLMVEIDGDIFAVPLESVVEIVEVSRSQMTTVHGQWIVPIRDRVVAVLTLGSIFRWNGQREMSGPSGSDTTTLVIVGEGDRQIGLAVQRVLGEEDAVIKSITDNFRNVAGIAGATILGDGRISLILDPPALIEMSSHPLIGTPNIQEKVQ